MQLKTLRLKKREEKRLSLGHVWVYSNEIDTNITSLKNFLPGESVLIQAADKTYLGTGYINPHCLITARLISQNINVRLNLDFFIARIKNALLLRERLFIYPYYRLIFAESDGLPGLIADRFADVLSIQMNTAGMDVNADVIIKAFTHVIPSIHTIILRNDSPRRTLEGLDLYTRVAVGPTPSQISIYENDTFFAAPLFEGQKTGWFYDHRYNRLRLKGYVKEKKILDVFSYLGGWGIQAARLGAARVTCVDSSLLAEHWILQNAKTNNVENKINVIKADALQTLKNFYSMQEKFDLVILDPPAFIKKQKDKSAGFLAYQRLNEAALKLLPENGVLISCSCSMHLGLEELQLAIHRASLKAKCNIQILEYGHQSADHPIHPAIPETSYLKMLIVRRLP